MLSKAFEWLRAADLSPDNAMVTTRVKAAAELEKKLRESENYSLLLGIVNVALGGCERLGEESPVFTTILECVRAQQPAFPSGISENSLHLRMVACLAIGELVSSEDPKDESASDELLASSLICAGLGLKPKEAGRHLDAVFNELGVAAKKNLQRQALALRARAELDWEDLAAAEAVATDPPTFNRKIIPAIKGLIESLETRHRCDREELEVMWWLYNGYSERLGKPIKSAAVALASAAIGCEIADRVQPPATMGLFEVVGQAAVRERTPAQTKAKSLDKVVNDLGNSGRKLLLPKSDSVQNLVRGSATALPLTWLFMRIEESQSDAGWEAELKAKSGVLASRELTPSEFASQVFAERQAQRVYQYLAKG